ncbi:hypothetical protein GCM10009788_21140 [Nocardioides humi]|uniref:DUF11 domain-containing protein n=2 Tax=Nocardioides humi TaxID=449461 RepID=A0ABN2AD37_9ACTN
MLTCAGLVSTPTALADPAPAPSDSERTTAGAFSFATPDGVCAVDVTIAGAAGGVSIVPNAGETIPADAAGAGAVIRFSVPATPGQVFEGTVGGAGGAGGGGSNGGGDAGAGTHSGGGGGGYTDVSSGGTLLALAGGGGGTGGGHVVDWGHGGSAGVPTGTGVFAGGDGMVGQDDDTTDPGDPSAIRPGGGQGGQTAAPGDGGVHATIPTQSGEAGTGRDGGAGAADPGADTGGGGGGGYFGGGGGASTKGDGAPNHGGGGGGGGASFVDGSVLFDSATLGSHDDGTSGMISLTWQLCEYDLAVTKTSNAQVFEPGVPVQYVVKVTNLGPEPMVAGDTVTITDAIAVGGTLTGVQSSGGGAAFTCTPAVGSPITQDEIDCSRPDAAGDRGLDVGETLTLTYSKALNGGDAVTNTVSVTDRGNPANNTAAATLAPAAPGLALVKKAKPKKITKAGQKVTFTYRVTNTGNIALNPVTVAETRFTGTGKTPKVKCPALPTGLQPGAQVVCTAKYTVTKKDAARGKIVNVAVANGATPGGSQVGSAPSKAVVKGKKKHKLPSPPATGARASVS